MGSQIFERPSGGRYGGRWISDRYLKSNIYQIFGVQKSVRRKTGSNPRPRIIAGKPCQRGIPFDHRGFILSTSNCYISPSFGDNKLRECYTTLGFTVELREGAIEQEEQYIAFGWALQTHERKTYRRNEHMYYVITWSFPYRELYLRDCNSRFQHSHCSVFKVLKLRHSKVYVSVKNTQISGNRWDIGKVKSRSNGTVY